MYTQRVTIWCGVTLLKGRHLAAAAAAAAAGKWGRMMLMISAIDVQLTIDSRPCKATSSNNTDRRTDGRTDRATNRLYTVCVCACVRAAWWHRRRLHGGDCPRTKSLGQRDDPHRRLIPEEFFFANEKRAILHLNLRFNYNASRHFMHPNWTAKTSMRQCASDKSFSLKMPISFSVKMYQKSFGGQPEDGQMIWVHFASKTVHFCRLFLFSRGWENSQQSPNAAAGFKGWGERNGWEKRRDKKEEVEEGEVWSGGMLGPPRSDF